MKDWKTDTLITTEDCVKFGKSIHVQTIIKHFERIEDETKSGKIYLPFKNINYIIVLMFIIQNIILRVRCIVL